MVQVSVVVAAAELALLALIIRRVRIFFSFMVFMMS